MTEAEKQAALRAELNTLLGSNSINGDHDVTLVAQAYDGVKSYALNTKDDIRWLDNERMAKRVARIKARNKALGR